MHTHNAWGGSFDVSMADSATEDDNRSRDLDRASLQRLEETQQSWLLGPSEKKKKDQYVDLGCMVCQKKIVKYIAYAFIASALITALVVMIVKLVPHHKPPPPPEDNYTKALHKTLLFFNAQKSGALPKNNNVSWRHSSATKDGQPDADLSGGYYDAGDNIKFNFPQAYTITILSWSVIEYSAKYEAMGELNHVKELIKWGTDYLLKTFNHTADKITQVYTQVGVGTNSGGGEQNDHTCWERPEDIDYQRPVATCSVCSDLGGEIAAALAAASIVFKDSNRQYSQELVKAAGVVYQFARGPHGRYSPAGTDVVNFYNSTSYWDEYVWSSAWLFFATGNTSYLQLATNLKLAKNAGGISNALDNRVFSWDNKLPGAQVLLTRLRIMINPGYPYEDVLNIYNNQTNINMCSYMPQFKAFNVTKGGLVQYNRGRPQPLQYNAAASFLAAVYADYLKASDVPAFPCGPNMMSHSSLRDFARSQINYILGDNPRKMSYIVGYSNRYPTRVHHRAASIPSNVNSRGCTTALKYRDAKSPNPHVLVGAMVAGPDNKDNFADVRSNYNYTEPTLVGNALVTAALVALSGGDTTSIDANALFSAVPPLYPPSPPPPAPWKP